jgi:universal stress protein E
MREPKRLLAVVDPTATSQPAVERAATVARSIHARLELFICDYDPQLVDSSPLDPRGLSTARAAFIEIRLRQLHDIANKLGPADLEIHVDARWDSPLSDGIVRKALESAADIVFKDTHYHPLLKRSVFSNTDWNLIRDCPALLWLAKPRPLAARPNFVAAVDPLHERAKPTELDDRIIAAAKQFCYPLNGELYVFHAFDMAPALAAAMEPIDSMPVVMPLPLPMREVMQGMRAQHTGAVHQLTDAHGIRRDCVHVQEGHPRELIVALTENLRADVIVMGAVSRRGLKRLFLGNTSEQVLDRLGCDLLIVKPTGFETSVRR